MLVYNSFFLISYLISLIGEHSKKKSKTLIFICGFLAIMIPSLLAGFRAYGVGTDTHSYIQNVFDICLHSNTITDAVSLVKQVSNIEVLYTTMNYIISRFFDSVNVVYFISEVLILSFSYLACYKNKEYIGSYSFSYLIFLMLFFNKSLNMCRQSIAISIILYASTFIFEKKCIKYFVFCLLASGFHFSAICMIMLYPLIYFVNNGSISKMKKIFVIILIICGLFFYENLIVLGVNYQLLDSHYLNYLNSGGGIIMIEYIFILITCFLIFALKVHQKNFIISNYSYLLFMSSIIYLIGLKSDYAYRISYYLMYFIIFCIPAILLKFKSNNRIFIKMFCIVIIFIYTYVYYQVYGLDETVPYRIVEGFTI